MSIKRMFTIIYGFFILLLIVMAGLTYLLYHNQQALGREEQIRYKSYQLADELRQSSDDLTRMARTYVVTQDPAYEKEYWHILDVRNGKSPRPEDAAMEPGQSIPLKELMRRLNFTEEEFGKLKEAEDNSNALVTTETIAMNSIKGLFADGKGGYTQKGEPDPEMSRRIMFDAKYHADKAIIMGPIDEFFALLDQRTKAGVARREKKGYYYLTGIIVITPGLIAASILSFLLIHRKVGLPVNRVMDGLNQLAQGDLTTKLEISSSDELGLLASGFNASVAQVREMIIQLSENVSMITEASAHLSDVSRELSAGADEMTTKAGSLHQSSGEALTRITTMAEASGQVGEGIATMAASIEDMTASIADIARNAGKSAGTSGEAAQIAQGTGQVVAQLNDSAQEIGQVIEVIMDIAEQTKLLALNATIEAARAGESGKGFAVVAGEVKELAGQTGTSTEDIRKQVQDIQENTSETVSAIENILNVVNQASELAQSIAAAVEEQNAMAAEIAANIGNAANSADQVSQGMSDVAELSREFKQVIDDVTGAAQGTAQAAGQVSETSQNLAAMSEAIKDYVARFRT